MVADSNVHVGGQAFVQCGISKQARASNEVALVHSSLSAIAINSFISSLELKGTSSFIVLLRRISSDLIVFGIQASVNFT